MMNASENLNSLRSSLTHTTLLDRAMHTSHWLADRGVVVNALLRIGN